MTIVLKRRGIGYASDVGLVSFTEGWLHYESRRCAFSLPSSGIRGGYGRPTLSFKGPGGTHQIVFLAEKSSSSFGQAFSTWSTHPSPTVENALFPPAYPSSKTTEHVMLAIVAAFVAIMAFAYALYQRDWAWSTLGSSVMLLSLASSASVLDENRRLRQGLPPRRLLGARER